MWACFHLFAEGWWEIICGHEADKCRWIEVFRWIHLIDDGSWRWQELVNCRRKTWLGESIGCCKGVLFERMPGTKLFELVKGPKCEDIKVFFNRTKKKKQIKKWWVGNGAAEKVVTTGNKRSGLAQCHSPFGPHQHSGNCFWERRSRDL